MLRRSRMVLLVACVGLLLALGGGLAVAAPNDGDALSRAQVELVEGNLGKLVAMAFDPTGRIFYTQKGGSVRLIVNDALVATPVITFAVDDCSERGLLGITLDPNFSSNHYIYVFYTVDAGAGCSDTTNVVVRFTESGGIGSNPVTIFSAPAVGFGNHNGGNIHFGPDGKLYISIGDDSTPANSQNLGNRNGKMHRINSDGTIPTDNPFYGQAGREWSIFAYGLRNSFDFDFDPVTGQAFASENGPDCDDEVNRIRAGYNYGWRSSYPCGDQDPTFNTVPPLYRWTPTIAPVGITFYDGNGFPSLRNRLFMCDVSGDLHYLRLNAARTLITQDAILSLPGGQSCNQDIETGTDGALYFVEGGGYTNATLYRIEP